MTSFNLEHFTRRLLTEALFYDAEYQAYSNLSLIDPQARRECYVASYQPDDDQFIIEKATEWEAASELEADDEIGYVLAVILEEYGSYETADEAADVLLRLAHQEALLPSITLLFEEDDVL